jgi:hypothetical protein
MTRPLTTEEKETLARFDKWLKRTLFNHQPSFAPPIFSTNHHIDAHERILIDSGRMILNPPRQDHERWEVLVLESGQRALEISLEETLLSALGFALKTHFVNKH